jgi:SPP1 gp7 family putative phage head morphogenesis protein
MRERLVLPGPETGKIKRTVKSMLRKARELGVLHIEQELGLQPRTYAKKSLFPTMDADLDRYETEKAFWITGIVKEDILKAARGYVFNWAKEHPTESVAGDGFEEGLYNLLKEWLPAVDDSGHTINQAARSEVIARTNIMDMYNHARLTMMQRPELKAWVQAYRYTAILDSVTTLICRGLHGKIFTDETLNGWIPPVHYSCRSMLLPVTLLDAGWQAEMAGQGPITVKPQEGFATGTGLPSVQEAARASQ